MPFQDINPELPMEEQLNLRIAALQKDLGGSIAENRNLSLLNADLEDRIRGLQNIVDDLEAVRNNQRGQIESYQWVIKQLKPRKMVL